jgi:hypothetical protein
MRYAYALFAVIATACRPPADPGAASRAADEPAVHVLKTYKLPPGHEKSVARLLSASSYPIAIVTDKGAQTQFVRVNPQLTGNGYMVLSAPEGIHAGVSELIATLEKAPAEAPTPSIEVTYWLVLGYPAAEADLSKAPEIAEALKALGNLGPMRFQPLETLRVASVDGEESMVEGQYATIHQTAAVDTGTIQLKLRIAVHGAEHDAHVETVLGVKPGQFAVLGHAGFLPRGEAGAAPATGAVPTLFYVARARKLD